MALFKRILLTVLFALGLSTAFAAESPGAGGTINLNFDKIEIQELVKIYAKASGKRFIVGPAVQGSVSLFNPTPLSLEEAYHQLGTALALNGYAIIKKDDVLVVTSARNAQRDGIETTTELPALKPERLVTWIFKPKYVSVEEINKRLRVLPSRDGEITPFSPSNSLVVTDFVSNIHRIAAIVKELDRAEARGFKSKSETMPPEKTPRMKAE